MNFNPRSREGSDETFLNIDNMVIISIHAPARGATFFRHFVYPLLHYFNPRSREGSDVIIPVHVAVDTISIHAPARGATVFFNAFSRILVISIHAPARGAT